MSFTAWVFLLGSFAVAGPLLAHLLAKPRFKRIPFTMLQFIETGRKDSQSRRRFRDFLILLLRCLIIVLLAMLFAGPLILSGKSNSEIDSVHYIGLDDSASMSYRYGGKSCFERMQSEVIDYIRSAEDDSVFNLYTLASGKNAENLAADTAISHVKKLEVSHLSVEAEGFVSEVNRTIGDHGRDIEVHVMVVSDFTPKSMISFANVDQSIKTHNVVHKNVGPSDKVDNAAIVTAHAGAFLDGVLNIEVTVANYGKEKIRRTLIAHNNDDESKPLKIELSSNWQQSFTVQMPIKEEREDDAFIPVEISLSKGDGLELDDKYYLAVSIPRQNELNVLVVGKSMREMFLVKTAAETISTMNRHENINVKHRLYNGFDVSLLEWADIVIYSSIPGASEVPVSHLKDFTAKGRKLVFFMNENVDNFAVTRLFDEGLLPARPGKYVNRRTYIEPLSVRDSASETDNSDIIIRTLENYRLDNVVVNSSYSCSPATESVCHWRYKNGNGFIYSVPVSNGSSVLVNTSADDSMSSLTRSGGFVAFCKYLLGETKEIGEHVFVCGNKAMLPVIAMEAEYAKSEKPVWVIDTKGRKRQASVADSFIITTDNPQCGWVNTLSKPTRCAGINLAEGETDMTAVSKKAAERAIKRIFVTSTKQQVDTAGPVEDKNSRPIWRYFAWALIILILAEALLANRMQR